MVCYKQLQSRNQDSVFVSQLQSALLSIFLQRSCLRFLLRRVLGEKQ